MRLLRASILTSCVAWLLAATLPAAAFEAAFDSVHAHPAGDAGVPLEDPATAAGDDGGADVAGCVHCVHGAEMVAQPLAVAGLAEAAQPFLPLAGIPPAPREPRGRLDRPPIRPGA